MLTIKQEITADTTCQCIFCKLLCYLLKLYRGSQQRVRELSVGMSCCLQISNFIVVSDLQEYLRFAETIKSLKHYLRHSQLGITFLYDFRMVILELFCTQLVN